MYRRNKFKKSMEVKRQLEIRDISMYLDHGLKGKEYKTDSRMFLLDEISISSKEIVWGEIGGHSSRIDCIPILHPLSDINKTIIVDGNKLNLDIWLYDFHSLEYYENGWSYEDDMETIHPVGLLQLPYEVVLTLIQYKFDINNLIGQGLAISVNDVDEEVYRYSVF